MDAYSLLRTLGALAIVLGMLAGALWIVRRYGIRLPGRIGSGGTQRLELVERTVIDGRRSVALLRRDGREHLILLAPEGNILLEAGIIRDEIDLKVQAERMEAHREAVEAARAQTEAMVEAAKAQTEAMRQSFVSMVDKACEAVKDGTEATYPLLVKARTQLVTQISTQLAPALARVPRNAVEVAHA